MAFARANQNQVATVNIWELQNHVKENLIDSDKQYRELSNLASTVYIPSLADLNDLQKELDKALQEGNLQTIGQMKGKYAQLLDTCFDDLCLWCKSSFDEDAYHALEQSKNQEWPERIRMYKNQINELKIQKKVNPTFNENLIIPAMELAYQQLELINQPDGPNKISRLQRSISAYRRIYNKAVEGLKTIQEEQTKKDWGREGFVIKNGEEYINVPGNTGFGNQQNKLREVGLSEAQIDFIRYHCNQSAITSVAPGIMTAAKTCANLVIDIQPQPQAEPKVLLRSIAYNNVFNEKGSFEFLGTAQLSIDISSLDTYIPGIHKGVMMTLDSDFFYNKQAQVIHGMNFSVPENLLTKSNVQKFQKDYEDFGEGSIKSRSDLNILPRVNDAQNFPYVQQRLIAAHLFNHDKTLNLNFYNAVCQNPYVAKETLDKAVSDSVVSNVSKMISSELENLGNNNHQIANNQELDNKNRERITDNVYESIRELIPVDAEKVVKQTISKLVLDVAPDKDVKMNLRQKVEMWWNGVIDLVTFKGKIQRLSQKVTYSRGTIQNNRSPRTDSSSRSF